MDLNLLKKEFLSRKSIKYLDRRGNVSYNSKKKEKFRTQNILTIYHHDITEYVL